MNCWFTRSETHGCALAGQYFEAYGCLWEVLTCTLDHVLAQRVVL